MSGAVGLVSNYREIEFLHHKSQIFNVLDAEIGPRRQGGGGEPRQYQKVRSDRDGQFDNIAHPCTASPTVAKPGNTFDKSLVSGTVRIRGSPTTGGRHPPASCCRRDALTSLSRSVESMTDTPVSSTKI